MIDEVASVFLHYEESGFAKFAEAWRNADWLLGQGVHIDSPASRVSGEAAGVNDDGELLIKTTEGIVPVSAGTVTLERAP